VAQPWGYGNVDLPHKSGLVSSDFVSSMTNFVISHPTVYLRIDAAQELAKINAAHIYLKLGLYLRHFLYYSQGYLDCLEFGP
jgi:hypothetical protein